MKSGKSLPNQKKEHAIIQTKNSQSNFNYLKKKSTTAIFNGQSDEKIQLNSLSPDSTMLFCSS